MANYIVHGRQVPSGTVEAVSGKNATIAMLFGALMIKGTNTFHDVSRVAEVDRVLELLASIGVKHAWEGDTTLHLDTTAPYTLDTIDPKACASGRISLLLMGALAHLDTPYKLYRTAGCNLGKRTVGPHVYTLAQLGVHAERMTDHYMVKNNTDRVGAEIVMYESGDTTTENVIMAAVLAKGTTTIRFASSNYMVQDLCHFLVHAGAKIDGIGTTTLTITGVDSLQDHVEYWVSPDPIDAMAWISLAVTTGAEMTITNCSLPFLELELEKLRMMGQRFELTNQRQAKSSGIRVADVTCFPSTLTALPDKIYGRPYPGLNIDNLPFFAPIATQAAGKTLIHDWPYENRALYNLEFQKLGASVILLDPHRVIIEGPTPLKAGEVVAPYAIRPAMSLLIAMIAAEGKSTLRNIYPIERAYVRLIERMQGLGITIERQED
jgi:UDP-N-acetylglucosamine 1-carboxyvinyltransferase